MPIQTDIPWTKFEEGNLNVEVVPAVNISGWNIRLTTSKRFGGSSGLIVKSCASGYNDVSGINVTNGVGGKFSVRLYTSNTSGLDYGCFATVIERLDSGSRSTITEGFLILLP